MRKQISETLGSYANRIAKDIGATECEYVGDHPDFEGNVCGYILYAANGDKIRYISDEGEGSFDNEEGFDEEWEKIVGSNEE